MRNVVTTVLACVIIAGIVASSSLWASWIVDGIPICTAANGQACPAIVSDGAGGAIIAWEDYRLEGGEFYEIYAQRIDASGTTLWTPAGVYAGGDGKFSMSGGSLRIASDGAGGAILAWGVDNHITVDVYAQRLSLSGSVLWQDDGVILSTKEGDQSSPAIATDGAGGAIVAFVDNLAEASCNVVAQRVSTEGLVQWTANGIVVRGGAMEVYNPCIISDGAGGAFVAWDDFRTATFSDVYAQRVSSSGGAQWPANGIAVCALSGSQMHPSIVPDGGNGAIIAWMDDRDMYYAFGIRAQRVNASGVAQWTANGVSLCTSTLKFDPYYRIAIVPDGAGGAIVSWADNRSGEADIYAQRVDASGTPVWAAEGVPICQAAGIQKPPAITSDGAGGAIIAWLDKRNGGEDIFAQHVDASGASLWMPDGVAVCTAASDRESPVVAADGAGGMIAAWGDNRLTGTYLANIYAQRACPGVSPVATLLQGYSALYSGSAIDIGWTLSSIDGGAWFVIARSVGAPATFTDVPSLSIAHNGLAFAWSDANVQPGTTYWYRVDVTTQTGRTTLFETGPVATPATPLALYQNQPNPFNPSTTIRYYLPERTSIQLEVYSASGERVATLVDRVEEKGVHVVAWKGRDDGDRQVASGIYFCSLRAGKETISRKMVLIR